MMVPRTTVDCGYVLHSRRYRENSLLLEVLTREHGRLGLVARHTLGARRYGPGGQLQPFRPLSFEWRGRGELPNLLRCEPTGRAADVAGERLFSGFYLNELILRFAERADPLPPIYVAYEAALGGLAGDAVCEPALRRFEVALLDACGYGVDLTRCADAGHPVSAEANYYFAVEEGVLAQRPAARHVEVPGTALLALAGQRDYDATSARAAKQLMRFAIAHHLGGRPLASRSLFRPDPDPPERPR